VPRIACTADKAYDHHYSASLVHVLGGESHSLTSLRANVDEGSGCALRIVQSRMRISGSGVNKSHFTGCQAISDGSVAASHSNVICDELLFRNTISYFSVGLKLVSHSLSVFVTVVRMPIVGSFQWDCLMMQLSTIVHSWTAVLDCLEVLSSVVTVICSSSRALLFTMPVDRKVVSFDQGKSLLFTCGEMGSFVVDN
jgi:hypothetical protein